MKKFIGTFVVLFFLVSGVKAEDRIGPFGSWYTNSGGSAFGGGFQYEHLFNTNFGLVTRLSFLTGGGESVLPLSVGVTGSLPLKDLSLYAIFTVGYYVPVGFDPAPPSALGFFFGGGIKIPISKSGKFFAEIGYVNAKSEIVETESGSGYGYTWTWERTTRMEVTGLAANLGVNFKI